MTSKRGLGISLAAGLFIAGLLAGCGGAGGGGGTGSFELVPSTQAVSVRQGGTSDPITLTTMPQGAFSNMIALVLTQAPAGVSGSFDPQQVMPGVTSTLTLSVAANVQPGEYPLTIGGIAAGANRSAALTLTVTEAAAQPPLPPQPPPPPPDPGVFVLSVSVSGSGSVSSTPAGIQCNPICFGEFQASTSVTLTAQPDPGWQLAGWGGACSGTAPTCAITMDAAKSVSATFSQQTAAPPPPPGENANLSGTWQGTTTTPQWGTENVVLTITQSGNQLGGALFVEPGNLDLQSDIVGTVSASSATLTALFTLGDQATVEYRFEGSVAGDSYSGILTLVFSTGQQQQGSFAVSRGNTPPPPPPPPPPPGADIDVSGTWEGTTTTNQWGTENVLLDITQTGSQLSGTLVVEPGSLDLQSDIAGTVSGTSATLTALFAVSGDGTVEYRFQGQVSNDSYGGSLTLVFSNGAQDQGSFSLAKQGAAPPSPPPPGPPPVDSNPISGTIFAPPGGDVINTMVFACFLQSDPMAPCHPQNSHMTFIGQSGPSATYSFSNMASGQYMVQALKDVNGNGQLDSGDFVGVYNCAAFDFTCQPTFVSPPQQNVNIQLVVFGSIGGNSAANLPQPFDFEPPLEERKEMRRRSL